MNLKQTAYPVIITLNVLASLTPSGGLEATGNLRSIPPWTSGTARLASLEEGDATLDGSTTCGYGALGALTWPGGAIGKISAKSAIFKLPERSCGACIEVKSDLNHSVTIQVVDTCDSCAPDVITLLQPQWASISATTASNGKSIHYRQVDCTPVQAWFCGGVVARVDQYKSDGTWMRVQFLQVAGPGRPSHVAVRSSLMSDNADESPWMSMNQTWGASWQITRGPAAPLDFQISFTSDECINETLLARGVVPSNGSIGLFPTGVQFRSQTPSAAPPYPPAPSIAPKPLPPAMHPGFTMSEVGPALAPGPSAPVKQAHAGSAMAPRPLAAPLLRAPGPLAAPLMEAHIGPAMAPGPVAAPLLEEHLVPAVAPGPFAAPLMKTHIGEATALGPLAAPVLGAPTPAPTSQLEISPAEICPGNVAKTSTPDLLLLRQVEKGNLVNEGSLAELFAPAPAPSTQGLLIQTEAPRPLLSPLDVLAPEPALPHAPASVTENSVSPTQAPDQAHFQGSRRSFLGVHGPGTMQHTWPVAEGPLGADIHTAAEAQAAVGAPTSTKEHVLQFSQLSKSVAAPQQEASGPTSFTMEFCRQLACPHNSTAAPGEALTAPYLPQPGHEPPRMTATKPPANMIRTPPPVQAPMTAAAAVASQLLSTALSNGQLADLVSTSKKAAQLAAAMPEGAPALPPNPVPGQSLEHVRWSSASLASHIEAGHFRRGAFGPAADVLLWGAMQRPVLDASSSAPDTSRGVLLTEAAGPAPEQLQPASMGQPDEILESLERGYLDEPGAKTTSPAGAAAAAPS